MTRLQKMPRLTVSYSSSFVELFKAGDVLVDGVEVGPWFSPSAIWKYRQNLPGIPFYYHAGSLISRVKFQEKAVLRRLGEYLSCTQSPWLSFHIELLPFHVFLLSKHLGIHPSPPDAKQSAQQFVEMLGRIENVVRVPILLENLPSLPLKKYNYASSPEIMKEIISITGAGLLLDIAHARIAATMREQDVRTYIERFPLDNLAQIHISGVRAKNGHLHDAHETLGEEDYQLLKWVLEKSEPQVVTLEYFKGKEVLREQLLRIQEIIAS